MIASGAALVIVYEKQTIMFTDKSLIKDRCVRMHCTQVEEKYIQANARKSGMTVPQYVRKLALEGLVVKNKTLPPEVLAFRGQLLHLSGQLHPLTCKRVNGDELNALERAELKQVRMVLEDVLLQIKKSFL